MSRHRRRKQIKVEGGDVYKIWHPPPIKRKNCFRLPSKLRDWDGVCRGGGVNAVHYATAQVNFFRIKTLVVKSKKN